MSGWTGRRTEIHVTAPGRPGALFGTPARHTTNASVHWAARGPTERPGPAVEGAQQQRYGRADAPTKGQRGARMAPCGSRRAIVPWGGARPRGRPLGARWHSVRQQCGSPKSHPGVPWRTPLALSLLGCPGSPWNGRGPGSETYGCFTPDRPCRVRQPRPPVLPARQSKGGCQWLQSLRLLRSQNVAADVSLPVFLMATAESGPQGGGAAGRSKLAELRKKLSRKLHEQAAAAKELNDMLTSPVGGAAAGLGRAAAPCRPHGAVMTDAFPIIAPLCRMGAGWAHRRLATYAEEPGRRHRGLQAARLLQVPQTEQADPANSRARRA